MSGSIGATLKEARRRRGLRVKDVAARTSARISPSYLSCIENDLRLPSEELLLELAELLGLDQRELYVRLVQTKAPAAIRDDLLPLTPETDSRYDTVKGLSLAELVERAAATEAARTESRALHRQVAQLEAAQGSLQTGGFMQRWQTDAARYRMLIEKTVVEASISAEGDLTVHRHVIGLRPRSGCSPIVVIQHTTSRLTELPGGSRDDGFKLNESPPDVQVEIERIGLQPKLSLFRLVFPDGLAHAPGKDRRVSYSFRSCLDGAYTMDPADAERVAEPLRDDRGGRATFIVAIDKPTEGLEVDVRFPRYYIPHEVQAWAGTQEFYEADDNFIDRGVCRSWELRTEDDYRVGLRVEHPLVGMKYGIAWKPLFQNEFAEVQRRLETERET